MSTKVNPTIQTKWGKANVWNTGYYTISDNSKDHYRELLHRLIFEDFYKIKNMKHKSIYSVDLIKLMNKVIDKGLIWKIMDISNAKKTAEKYGYNLEELMYVC